MRAQSARKAATRKAETAAMMRAIVRREANVVTTSMAFVKRSVKRQEAVPARPDGDDAPSGDAKQDAMFGTAAASTACCPADVFVAIAAKGGVR